MKTLYSPSDVAEQLGIQSSTLRKYADVLEKEGYTFIKNERGHRKYRESDVMVFRKVINLKSDTDMTLENATKQIVSWYQGIEVLPLERHEVERYEEPDLNATPLQEMIQEQKEVIEKQNELLQELTKRLTEQDQRFAQRESELLSAIQSIQNSQKLIATNSSEDIVKNQGRDEMLMQTIREVQEVKKLIAASKDKKWYEFWK
ncbi:DNA-binding protein [Bacillus thuringiensis]|uniref:DUF3967 domain-containing protein n=1 Tax=Bacillus cereus group TaxID=86661 RepID=UPI000B43FE78|nr:DUF3967 domain-containing protein [Bacillus thuringiensis]MCU4932595.1 DUF3967 domain-containing protein [Bacillus cereus]MCU5037850.1 DUF3967 domain-containing protein [Bacillus cereus]OTX86485.1 DNA-binding protein [Bacillus thuringiensis serovar londrina]PFT73473.1 DNA-binding protein [Bacillus thuringiensis]